VGVVLLRTVSIATTGRVPLASHQAPATAPRRWDQGLTTKRLSASFTTVAR
jgi:hypothetical protein